MPWQTAASLDLVDTVWILMGFACPRRPLDETHSTPAPIERDLDALRIGLSGYNQAVAGSHLREQVASFIKDEQGLVLGGILADIKWGWLHIDWLWIDERIRKDGLGRPPARHHGAV